jgi:anaerobic glycerol-3-phosphate dehydrogenase
MSVQKAILAAAVRAKVFLLLAATVSVEQGVTLPPSLFGIRLTQQFADVLT